MLSGKAIRLTKAEQLALLKRWRKGDRQACDRLVASLIAFVARVCARYTPIMDAYGLEMDDAVQEGCLGLLRSFEDYDPAKGAITTHAHSWVRAYVGRWVKLQGPVHVPVGQHEKTSRMLAARNRFYQQRGRYPEDEELADILGTNVRDVRRRRASFMATVHTSLDEQVRPGPRTEGEELTVMEYLGLVSDTPAPDSFASDVRKALEALDPRERRVIRQRYLDGEMTLQEIGDRVVGRSWGGKRRTLSRERIRQIEAGAFAKLRKVLTDGTG